MITLRKTIQISAPIHRCFDLVRSVDVHVETGKIIQARAEGGKTTGLPEVGDETHWSAKFFGIRFYIATQVQELSSPTRFQEGWIKGFFQVFEHEYLLEEYNGITTVTDIFRFESPGWLISRIVDSFILEPQMRFVQAQRLDIIQRIAESDEWKKYLTEST
ncbi:MAG: hypothetical protein KTR14_06050 [Vampirovibrio sp.]|nr:hypothetical protein [Vampirovibrio sp.]